MPAVASVEKPSSSAPLFFYLNHSRKLVGREYEKYRKLGVMYVVTSSISVAPEGVLFERSGIGRAKYEERISVFSPRLAELLGEEKYEKGEVRVRCTAPEASSEEEELVCAMISAGLMLTASPLYSSPSVIVFNSRRGAKLFERLLVNEEEAKKYGERIREALAKASKIEDENERKRYLLGFLLNTLFGKEELLRPIFVCTEEEKFDECRLVNAALRPKPLILVRFRELKTH